MKTKMPGNEIAVNAKEITIGTEERIIKEVHELIKKEVEEIEDYERARKIAPEKEKCIEEQRIKEEEIKLLYQKGGAELEVSVGLRFCCDGSTDTDIEKPTDKWILKVSLAGVLNDKEYEFPDYEQAKGLLINMAKENGFKEARLAYLKKAIDEKLEATKKDKKSSEIWVIAFVVSAILSALLLVALNTHKFSSVGYLVIATTFAVTFFSLFSLLASYCIFQDSRKGTEQAKALSSKACPIK